VPLFHDQHPIKRLGLTHIMGDTEQRGLPPQPTGASQQLPTVLAVEPPAWLIEDDQPHPRLEHGPPKSHPLTFPARDQGAPFAEPCLQPVGQPLQDTAQMGLCDGYALKAGQLTYDCRYSTMHGMPVTGGRGFRGLKPLWYNSVPP
jgi:hypothetical protein